MTAARLVRLTKSAARSLRECRVQSSRPLLHSGKWHSRTSPFAAAGGGIGATNTKLGVAKRIAGICRSLSWRSRQAWRSRRWAGSAFCLLSPSRRLLSFAAPILRPLPLSAASSVSRACVSGWRSIGHSPRASVQNNGGDLRGRPILADRAMTLSNNGDALFFRAVDRDRQPFMRAQLIAGRGGDAALTRAGRGAPFGVQPFCRRLDSSRRPVWRNGGGRLALRR